MHKHGHAKTGAKTAEYRAWRNMLTRCYNTKCKEYKNYGGRGIRVSRRWMTFAHFLADTGAKPSTKHSIDRRNNAKGYNKRNCWWATRKEQMRNMRKSVYIAIDGVRLTVAGWTERLHLPPFLIYSRLRAGWKPRDAVLRPKNVYVSRNLLK